MPAEPSTNKQFHLEFCEISQRIRKSLEAIVPEEWDSAELVIREADPFSDDFLEVDTPLLNPATDEIIGGLPPELADATVDLYLLFFPYQRPWETCVISLTRRKSGSRLLGTDFYYAEK